MLLRHTDAGQSVVTIPILSWHRLGFLIVKA
jgi:hypothetical protein